MNNRVRNLLESTVTEIVMLIIFACLATMSVIERFTQNNVLELSVGICLATILTGYLVWASYILITRKSVDIISRKQKLIIVSCDVVLYMTYCLLSFLPDRPLSVCVASLFAIIIWIRVFREFQMSRQ